MDTVNENAAKGTTKSTIRQYWVSLALVAIFGVANVIFSYLNYTERMDMRREASMSREMLNARAMILQLLISATAENRALTPGELTQINRLWVTAEFDTEKRPTIK